MIILSKWLHFILNAQLVFCERLGGKRQTPTKGIEYDNSTQQWRGSDKYSHLAPAIMYHQLGLILRILSIIPLSLLTCILYSYILRCFFIGLMQKNRQQATSPSSTGAKGER